ncbi:MAG: phosphatidylserine decarboxylase family protein [Candidatus Aureabacteria bacterium]|nr:phosphatidylserine decarboxylase family protein [Candidatus Auribacterota bacterium]
MRIPIAKEGFIYILLPVLLGAVLMRVSASLAVSCFVLALGFACFFRSPRRTAVATEGDVVAPADGRVMRIDEIEEQSYLGRRVHRISIFLSVFDVHINYAPVSGTVDYMHYRKGSFKNAMNDIASVVNENNTIGIKWQGTTMAIRQIAGMIARRIVCRCAVGDCIRAGQKIGMIKFSSRVDVFLPLDAQLMVAPGQRVRGGETVIARCA